MIDQKIKLITGSLLHDIGKVVYREGSDRRNHSVLGYDFLKEEGKIDAVTNSSNSGRIDSFIYCTSPFALSAKLCTA